MRRTLRPLAALAILAVISAGCSNAAAQTGTNSSAANTNAATRQQAAKFAECMRANGVREFPDPDASGTYTIDGLANGSSLDTSSAAFERAIAACKDLQPPGFIGHTRTAQEQENALKFAQCIRNNGVKDFPDPTPDGPLVDTNRIPSAAGRGGVSIPGLREAMEKCRDLAANAGVSGGR
jgi:Tfp pilus assembly protein PilV